MVDEQQVESGPVTDDGTAQPQPIKCFKAFVVIQFRTGEWKVAPIEQLPFIEEIEEPQVTIYDTLAAGACIMGDAQARIVANAQSETMAKNLQGVMQQAARRSLLEGVPAGGLPNANGRGPGFTIPGV